MRAPFLIAALSMAIGTLLSVMGGSLWILLVPFAVLIPLRPKVAALWAFSLLGFLLSIREVPDGIEVLGKVSSTHGERAVVSEMMVWSGEKWVKLRGRGEARGVVPGRRVYCEGVDLRPKYPEYSLKKCWDFPVDQDLIGRWKERAFKVREKFKGSRSVSVDMAISNPRREAKEAGLSHLFAFSGFHTGILFFMILSVVSYVFPSMFLSQPISLLILFLLVQVSGPSPSAIRAFSMLLIHTFSRLVDYPLSVYNILGLSAFFSMMLDPWIILSPSFSLSYAATLGVLVALEKREGRWWRVPVFAYLFSLPVQVIFFGSVNLFSPILSIALAPLASLAVALGEIVVILGFMGLWRMAELVAKGLWPLDWVLQEVMKLAVHLPKVRIPASLVVISFALVWIVSELRRSSEIS